MYTPLSECSLYSSTEPRINPVRTFFDASEDFVEFFSGRTGMYELLLHEDKSNVRIKLQPRGITISHSPDVTVKPIEMSLWNFFYDVEFTRCLRLSVLNSRCPASQILVLNRTQYALLHQTKFAITRDVGLTEIFMDDQGRVCLYGSPGSVVRACVTIKKMFNIHGLGDPEIMPPSTLLLDEDFNNNSVLDINGESVPSGRKSTDEGWNIETPQQQPLLSDSDLNMLETSNSQSSTSGRGRSINQSCSFNSMANGSFRSPSKTESSPRLSTESVAQRTSIRFFVKKSDAPRLIGARGATKRRIENVTGCTILLHTDKRDSTEFPVEVISTSAKRCEIAHQHILGFLAGASKSADGVATAASKIKEAHAQPKVHLDISPKKVPKKHTD